ncbi:MAG: CocE/NonD family hydrolase [Actinobacteria bacterium]|nr:CocE/NonD family hydrolase [Actinomycetota bacterium]
MTADRRQVRVEPNVWVTMSDGCQIALRLWLPVDADDEPVPAVLEAHPYRKSDCTAPTDESRHRYTAEHGYASVRMDIRGAGDSDGVLEDEYLPQEQLDIAEVISWLAAQPWCTGSVGMYGISWGGFNSLQVAARRPPELKAIISVCGTDDRYADDVHYMGGCIVGSEMLSWSTTMLAYNARPPDPDVVGDRWRDMWMSRLQRATPPVETWLGHQRRDDYWKQGSVCVDYDAIQCPVYLVGGWSDAYRNSITRMLDRWPHGVTRAVIGPWGHMYPHNGVPGPAIGFMQESVRWWDHWLKGIDTGLQDEPPIHVWIPEAVEPKVSYTTRPGEWIEIERWSDLDEQRLTLHLTPNGLLDTPVTETIVAEHGTPTTTASHPGAWCAAGRDGDFPGDQRGEDGQSLSFTTLPLGEQMNIVGVPFVRARVAADHARANLVVRLCDVAPDGTSTLITRGVLNLTHRDSHERPAPIEPDVFYDVELALGATGYAVPEGHRLRVALSGSLWPLVWPAPQLSKLAFDLSGCSVELPLHSPAPGPPVHPFAEPESAPPLQVEYVGEPHQDRRTEMRDIVTGQQTLTVPRGYPVVVRFVDADTTYDDTGSDVFEIVGGEPLSATARSDRAVAISRGGWSTRVEVQATMTCEDDDFVLEHTLDAFEGDNLVARRSWVTKIPRDHT